MKEKLIKDIQQLLKTVTEKELKKNPSLRSKNKKLVSIIYNLSKRGV